MVEPPKDSNNKPLEVCILAAGMGSRMCSETPKVLQTLAGKPLLAHLLGSVKHLNPAAIHVVVGQGADAVKARFETWPGINWVHQSARLGTGHAVLQASPHFNRDARVVILLGDAPLVSPATIKGLLQVPADLAVLTVNLKDPSHYGRIIRDGKRVVGIVEEPDASADQRKITEINTGVMAANVDNLCDWLTLLSDNNAQHEYLLTDIVQHANQAGAVVGACLTNDPLEVMGVNTFSQLAILERNVQKKVATELMDQGVQLMDPERLDVRGSLTVGTGVVIDVNVIIEGEVQLGDQVSVGPNCVIRDSRIGSGTKIRASSMIEEAIVGKGCTVGPFARLRPGAELSDEVAVGNFVEVKKSKLGKGAKANHLAYLGDAMIGEQVNIGAGTITCNYDGVAKHQTHIGDAAFIGSNASLVAPLSIGAGATIGAGSTITRDVQARELALGRGKQKSLPNWQHPAGTPDKK